MIDVMFRLGFSFMVVGLLILVIAFVWFIWR